MAMVRQSGFSLVETMVGIALLGVIAVGIMNFSKQDAQGSKVVGIKETSSLIMKDLLVMLEHKTLCTVVLGNKRNNDPIAYTSPDGILIQEGILFQKKYRLTSLRLTMKGVTGLPAGYDLATINYTLTSLDNKIRTSDKISILTALSGAKISDCITPRENGEALIENKAIDIAKSKVCREDLKGTLKSNGKCNWPEPVNYEYVEVQL